MENENRQVTYNSSYTGDTMENRAGKEPADVCFGA